MTTTTLQGRARAERERAPRAARLTLSLLERIAHGQLRVDLPDGSSALFGSGEPSARIRIHDWGVFPTCLRHGDIGFADAYIDGRWETDDLRALLDVVVANRKAMESLFFGNPVMRAVNRLRHLLRRNSRAGAKRNIHAHYDIGNAFYRLWLDETMTYSSALFGNGGQRTLADAQRAKYDRMIDELDLDTGAHVLEIGCGWGGFIERAVGRGLRVDGLTISEAQREHARERLADALQTGRADVLLRDYRDEQRRFDGIVSIEMFEAVGETYWPAYFRTLAKCLAPGARAVVQTITIDDALFENYRRSTDFIQQTIFPGGMLPSPTRFREEAAGAGLRVEKAFSFGQDYANTLAQWYGRFTEALPEVRAQGFDTRFERTWALYLAYCEAAFKHRNTDVFQFTLTHAER